MMVDILGEEIDIDWDAIKAGQWTDVLVVEVPPNDEANHIPLVYVCKACGNTGELSEIVEVVKDED